MTLRGLPFQRVNGRRPNARPGSKNYVGPGCVGCTLGAYRVLYEVVDDQRIVTVIHLGRLG
jgi:ParE toxin of type II toxin-antitoxin system, parDE